MNSASYDCVDDYLGPAETRFFGAGYRRADYRFGPFTVGEPDDGGRPRTHRSTVSVRYPVDWSRKAAGVDLRPHLSSVDVITIAVQMCDAYLATSLGLDPRARARAWLRTLTLRSGTEPQEELDEIGISVELISSAVEGEQQVSLFRCQVGVMRARCEVVHPPGATTPGPASEQDLERILGPAARRYYGEGFKAGRQRITEVALDLDAFSAQAVVEVGEKSAMPIDAGIEGAYRPGVSLIDCFVSVLQLAQVLLYELDGIDRRHSNTLWMLQTVLSADGPPRPGSGTVPGTAALTGTRLLPLNGGTWRNADIAGQVGGVQLRSSFAHELSSPVPVNG